MSVHHATTLRRGSLYPGCDRNRTLGAVESTGRRAARPRDGRGLSCGGWRPRPLLRFRPLSCNDARHRRLVQSLAALGGSCRTGWPGRPGEDRHDGRPVRPCRGGSRGATSRTRSPRRRSSRPRPDTLTAETGLAHGSRVPSAVVHRLSRPCGGGLVASHRRGMPSRSFPPLVPSAGGQLPVLPLALPVLFSGFPDLPEPSALPLSPAFAVFSALAVLSSLPGLGVAVDRPSCSAQ